jgi:short chain dehydrogenase
MTNVQDHIRFDGRVAIVTGAGAGLGRQHALALASRGAKVLVNDFSSPLAMNQSSTSSAAESVVAEIRNAGGIALANNASVTDFDAMKKMVDEVMSSLSIQESLAVRRAHQHPTWLLVHCCLNLWMHLAPLWLRMVQRSWPTLQTTRTRNQSCKSARLRRVDWRQEQGLGCLRHPLGLLEMHLGIPICT